MLGHAIGARNHMDNGIANAIHAAAAARGLPVAVIGRVTADRDVAVVDDATDGQPTELARIPAAACPR